MYGPAGAVLAAAATPAAGTAITKPEKVGEGAPLSGDDRVLRAKYVDWCSAQVADQFLALSPTEIFELAERAASGGTTPARPSSHPAGAADLQSYTALIEQVTEVLWQQMDLPTYEEWLEQYRRNPAVVEDQLLGFWKEAL